MKKTKFTEQQIAFALRQAETGTRVVEVCRKLGISDATFYNWKRKTGNWSALQAAYRVSTRRACEVIGLHRTTYYYQAHRPTDSALRHRLKELAAVRIRYGYQRLYILLRREGWQVNHKKVYRLYCEEGLNLRSKRPPQRRAAAHRLARPENREVNHCWSMDFVADSLFNGRCQYRLKIPQKCRLALKGESMRKKMAMLTEREHLS